MAAAVTDKFKKVKGFFSTTLASQKASGAASMSLSDATGVPTTTGLVFTVGRVDSSGTATPSARAIYKGTLSGTTVSNLTLSEGTDQTHAAGTVVEITWTETHWNDAVDGILVEHNQDGTHSSISVSGNIDINDSTTAIRDTSDNELIKFSKTSSAVNEVTVTNAATGNAPQIAATGGDTNIPLKLSGKGTGAVQMYVNGVDQMGAWQDWTPTLTNFTLGNGTITAKYIQIGKTVHVNFSFTLGSTSSVGSAGTISTPVTASNNYVAGVSSIGNAIFIDSSTSSNNAVGYVRIETTTTFRPVVGNGTTTYVTQAGVTSAIPFTWATGDQLVFTGTYEAA